LFSFDASTPCRTEAVRGGAVIAASALRNVGACQKAGFVTYENTLIATIYGL